MEKIIYALGFFDGVHLGHQALLCACRELAGLEKAKAGVLTFAGSPQSLMKEEQGLITTLEERKHLFSKMGMEEVLILPFDENLKKMLWQDFYRLLVEKYNASGFVCGEDFRFGAGGEGTAASLQALCQKEGLSCRIVEKVELQKQMVSSRTIRRFLEEGRIEKANAFLGHPYLLTGKVEPGKQLGRTIGVPTANLSYSPERVKLPYGVYACRVNLDGRAYAAVANIGTRPTVKGKNVTVEPWILDFAGDLYGKALSLEVLSFLRPEKKFPDLAALKAQIGEDALRAREIFEKTGDKSWKSQEKLRKS